MTTDTVGGVWHYGLELAAALTAGGCRVDLAAMGEAPDPGQREAAGRIEGLTLFEGGFRLEWMDAPWEDVRRAGEWLLQLAEERRPDVVHLNDYAQGSLPFGAPVLVVGHSCVLSWWLAVRGEAAPARLDRYRDAVGRGIRGADRVAAPTRWMLDSLDRHYGPLPPARVVPNGRSGRRFRPGRKEPVVFACGRMWDDGKNLASLEHVADRLPWPVEVAGSLAHPEGGERGTRAVRSLGVLPPDEVGRRMGRAAICAHPARYEPFGLVPLEAALCGCALVLGDIPTLRELWGDAALFVDPEEPAEVQDALDRLVRSEALRSDLAARARARAAGMGPERMVAGYGTLYREMRAEAGTMAGRAS